MKCILNGCWNEVMPPNKFCEPCLIKAAESVGASNVIERIEKQISILKLLGGDIDPATGEPPESLQVLQASADEIKWLRLQACGCCNAGRSRDDGGFHYTSWCGETWATACKAIYRPQGKAFGPVAE